MSRFLQVNHSAIGRACTTPLASTPALNYGFNLPEQPSRSIYIITVRAIRNIIAAQKSTAIIHTQSHSTVGVRSTLQALLVTANGIVLGGTAASLATGIRLVIAIAATGSRTSCAGVAGSGVAALCSVVGINGHCRSGCYSGGWRRGGRGRGFDTGTRAGAVIHNRVGAEWYNIIGELTW
jgi:hypothetical protein